MRIYVTHCSAKKKDALKRTGREVFPYELYTATPLQRFTKKCKEVGVEYAIFSDLYGVWFSTEKHDWYEKDPDTVTEKEFTHLLENFDRRLKRFDEIWFYHNPGRFHPLYKKLLRETQLRGRVRLFTHIADIT